MKKLKLRRVIFHMIGPPCSVCEAGQLGRSVLYYGCNVTLHTHRPSHSVRDGLPPPSMHAPSPVLEYCRKTGPAHKIPSGGALKTLKTLRDSGALQPCDHELEIFDWLRCDRLMPS
jgi:hypothetical protein